MSALHLTLSELPSLGQGEKIAVVDTGFDSTGLENGGPKIVDSFDMLIGTSGTDDDNGHGTMMGSIIANRGAFGVWGLAPMSTLIVIKAFSADGQSSPEAVADGVLEAVKAGASVINLSLATATPSPALGSAVASAEAAGAVVVAAAGDTGADGPEFPAADPGVVAVYGQDEGGGIAASSNHPIGPAALAPGVDVDAIKDEVGGMPHRTAADGTSAAAAVESGILADCLAAHSSLASRTAWCVSAVTISRPGVFINVPRVLGAPT